MDFPEDLFLQDPAILALRESKELIAKAIIEETKHIYPQLLSEEFIALRETIFETEWAYIFVGIWDGFHSKMKALSDAQFKNFDEKALAVYLANVRKFWDDAVMKCWPDPLAKNKPTFSQKLKFLLELYPGTSIWQNISRREHPSQGLIFAVHSAYSKVAENGMLSSHHEALIEKWKAKGLIK